MRTCATFVLVSTLALLTPSVGAEWWLWDSPSGGTEVVDQQQTVTDTQYGMFDVIEPPPLRYGVGQIFVPQQTPLYRIDLLLHNAYDDRPVRFRLWPWAGTYETTTSAAPVFEDLLLIPGPDVKVLVSTFPRVGGAPLPVTVGTHYYFELDNVPADGNFAVFGSMTNAVPPTPDWYTCPPPAASICDVRVNNFFQPPGDLYFKTYSSPVGLPPPPPCCTFSTTTSWSEPTLSQDQKTFASDYAWFVEQWAAYQTPYHMTTVHRFNAHQAFFEAFKYRKNTNDATALANAVTLLENAYICRFGPKPPPPPLLDDCVIVEGEEVCSCPSPSATDWVGMERPSYAYLWIQGDNTGVFSPTARAHAKELIIESARLLWPIRERGLMNRAFWAALNYKLVSQIVVRGVDVPADEYDRWVAYADGVWNDFKANWDTEEDAVGYNFLAWHALLELAMAYGEDTTIWAQPGFRSLVERYYKQMSPLGVSPSTGDGGNGINLRWPTIGWFFHKASVKWNDPRYKWLGDRVFDWHRTHIKPPLPLWQAVYTDEWPAFAHGYFEIASAPDWSAPPANVQELLAARQDQTSSNAWTHSSIGQQFKPTDKVLAALTLKVKNRGNTTPGTVKLWKWLGSYNATVAAGNPVLFQESVPFTSPNPTEVVFEPYLELNTADTYFFEVTRSTNFDLLGSPNNNNPYPNGMLFVNHLARNADAWFITKTLSADGSTFTTRRQFVQRLLGEFQESTDVNSPLYPNKYYDILPTSIPDKLVLRSGYNRDDLTFVVNLVPGDYNHAHQETAQIFLATDKSSVLISGGSAREDSLLKDQSVPIAKRYWGGVWQALAEKTIVGDPAQPTLRGFSDFRKATVAVITWDDTFGWNLQQQRRFLFVKNRFLVVRDKTFFEGPMRASTGPIWHARDMTGDLTLTQRNWYDLFDRVPQGLNGWRFYNPERYLFTFMAPKAGREHSQELKPYVIGNPLTPGYVAYQRWTGDATTNQSTWTDSVLLPHDGTLTPPNAAAKITPFTLSGSADAWAVRVEIAPDEFWYVIDNPTGATITATTPVSLTTDARYAVVRQKTGVTQHYVLTYDASILNLGTIFTKTWGTARTSVEMNGNIP